MLRHYLRRAGQLATARLNAAADFKLLLKTAITDLPPSLRRLAMLTDYYSGVVQPIPIQAPFGDSVLVLAPHQDDELIGPGGALALQVRAGKAAHVMILQDGGGEASATGMSRAEVTALRNRESARALAVLGVRAPQCLDLPDLAAALPAATAAVRDVLAERRIDAVFAPFVLDAHPDHWLANCILAGALRTYPGAVRVFGYEVWGACLPNVIAVIDAVMDRKLEALACYEFANQAVDYVHSTKGYNMSHSRWLPPGAGRFAERFCELPKAEYVALVDRLAAVTE